MFAVEEDEEGGNNTKLKLYRNFKTDMRATLVTTKWNYIEQVKFLKCVHSDTKLKVFDGFCPLRIQQKPEVRPQVPQAHEWESLLRNKEYYEGLKRDFRAIVFRGQK